jgi:hypothetical protein
MPRTARLVPIVTCIVLASSPEGSALAQLRPGQPGVLDPPPRALPAPMPDFAGEFRKRYEAAGRPRFMLFWNVELSDRAHADVVRKDRETFTGSSTRNDLKQDTSGDAGSSTLTETSTQRRSQREREVSMEERAGAARATTLSARNAAQFERAFETQMRNGGAQLVDRAMALRASSLDKDNATADSKVLESAAMRSKADFLLQVLFVTDESAPIGYGFDISVRDVTSGGRLVSFYTRAVPPPPPVRTGYVATERGFELRSAPLAGTSLEDVAVQLAREVMNELGPTLTARK